MFCSFENDHEDGSEIEEMKQENEACLLPFVHQQEVNIMNIPILKD